jgi:hypothetical protein
MAELLSLLIPGLIIAALLILWMMFLAKFEKENI